MRGMPEKFSYGNVEIQGWHLLRRSLYRETLLLKATLVDLNHTHNTG